MCAVPRERLARVHASSGTTGKPTIVGYTKNDLDLWEGLVARSIAAAGGRPGDLLHNALWIYWPFSPAGWVCMAARNV